MSFIIAAYALLTCTIWCLVYIKIIRALSSIPFFDKLNPPEPEIWPKLSIIIPACNEADTIERALSTLLEQDYPDMEVIVVNDRSTDDTAGIVNALAGRFWSLKVIHIDSLPEGWLGKVHAQHLATQRARGEWILYTDADVHFRQGALKKGVALALSEGADHLAIAPGLLTKSFLLDIVINAFAAMFIFFTDAGRVNSGRSKRSVGVGAFNLVRRGALARTEGFSWLRMEVADDVGLALLLKNSGAKSYFALAREDINLTWYSSVKDMFKGLEKNIFGATCSYSYPRLLLIFTGSFAYALAPIAAVIFSKGSSLWVAGLIAYLLLIIAGLIKRSRFSSPILPDIFLPLGQIIIAFMLLRAGFLCWQQDGIAWRGTVYRLSELKSLQRVKL